ncbi:hypothetical protein TrCOL_g8159 [Triparma columacea]|nr:hypothetical protein TrCOL_g8159 [Triparma columacea]
MWMLKRFIGGPRVWGIGCEPTDVSGEVEGTVNVGAFGDFGDGVLGGTIMWEEVVMGVWEKAGGWGRPVIVERDCGVAGWVKGGRGDIEDGEGTVFAVTEVKGGTVKFWVCEGCLKGGEGRDGKTLVEELAMWVKDVRDGKVEETRREDSTYRSSQRAAAATDYWEDGLYDDDDDGYDDDGRNGGIIVVTSNEQFLRVVEKGVTLVTVGTGSCGPCKMIYPHLSHLALSGEGEALGIDRFVLVDGATTEVGVEGQFDSGVDVEVFPDFRVWEDGVVRDKWEGAGGAKEWMRERYGKTP